MYRNSIYMGPRLKRIRRDLGLTQANMASELEISPSYVALMERNQRPVTAELLLKLAKTFRIDLADLADGSDEELTVRLVSVLKQPIFADIDLRALDIADVATSYPGFAEALLRLNTAHEEVLLQLSEQRELAQGAPGGGEVPDPVTEARNFLAARRNCFSVLEDRATLVAENVSDTNSIVARLKERHGLSVRFVEPQVILGGHRWHYSHRKEVFVSEALSDSSRRFQLALQLAVLEASDDIDLVLSDGQFASDNGRLLAHRALLSYWAAALLMPYRPFVRAARKKRHDIEALSREFGTSFEQVAHRLTTLQSPGEEGVPFFFVRFDEAGNVSKRLDGAGFPFARHGGSCTLWNVHRCFASPNKILVQRLELPDGQQFVSFAATVSTGGGGYQAARVERAVALACEWKHADHVIYADALRQVEPTPIGISCRLCHRPKCVARAAPPVGRELRSDTYGETGIPFAFATD